MAKTICKSKVPILTIEISISRNISISMLKVYLTLILKESKGSII